MINNLKRCDTWKIHSAIAINFISSKYNNEERVIHSKSDKVKIMINDRTDEAVKELQNRY